MATTKKSKKMKNEDTETATTPGVAIIGMSCVFPQAGDLRAFWENILNKRDCITEVPSDRWDWKDYFDPDKNARDKIYSKWGGFIDPVLFNPMKFGIPPNSLKSIDPVQLLSLEAAARALADAGYATKEFDREHTACIYGLAGGMGDFGLSYGFRAGLPLFMERVPEDILKQLPEWTEDSFPGVLPNVVTGRIANCLNLGGSNFTVDAACASALTAVYIGVREITSGQATTAIVGAADTLMNPHGFLCFSKTKALSPNGKSRPFDEAADGICISEGIGALVLKRLDLAEKDGDRIYAVIRGVGSSSDGKGKSLTAPRTPGQLRALKNAYDMAGFSVGTVELVEAHGTGTVLGDGTEAESMAIAMTEAGAAAKSCAVGSVKSNIGHTKGCAGVAGLIKAALSLHYKVLPPTINVKRPSADVMRNPDSPVYVNADVRPWIPRGATRRAGVNSFGFGGTNFHAVMEEHSSDRASHDFALHTWPCELFVWIGRSADLVGKDAGGTLSALSALKSDPALRDVANRVYKSRGEGSFRLAIVAESVADLREKLTTAVKQISGGTASIKDPRGIYFGASTRTAADKVAFLFPGQGSQRPDMMRDLAILFPELRDGLARADGLLADRLTKRLSDYMYPPARFSDAEETEAMREITVTNIAQPSLGVTEIGMHKILGQLGIKPDMTAGHSSGEYSALCASGVFSEDKLYEILEDRGSSILNSATGDLGTMMAVKGKAEDLKAIIKDVPGVYVANFNSPSQTIISGLKVDLEKAATKLEAAGLKCRFIPVSCAFHSPIIQPARDFLGRKLKAIHYEKPAIPVYSNLLAAPYPTDEKHLLETLTDHLIGSVRFVEQIERMYADGARIFIEVGPGNVLTNLVGQILSGKPHVAVATDAKSPRHDLYQLMQTLGQLAVAGVDMMFDRFFAGRGIAELDTGSLHPVIAPEKHNAVSYWVAPDRAWPVNQTRPIRKKVDLVKSDEVRVVQAAPVSVPTATALPGVPAGHPLADVMVKYQRLMGDFLKQQRDVMFAFLGGDAAALEALGGMPTGMAIPSAPVAAPVVRVPATPAVATPVPVVPPAKSTPVPVVQSTTDHKSRLLALVAERTGYPNEMLDLNLNIESDLGIDSIKRLEILIAFAKEIPGAPDDLPEQLNTSKTLGEVLAKVGGFAPVAVSAPAPVPTVVAPAPSAPTVSDHKSRLLALVAERTGYPTDMLDLNLNIESDLGIDSIKRLEILIAFAKEIPGAPDDLPEQLNTSKTLGEVLAMVEGFAPAPAVATPVSGVPPAKSSPVVATPVPGVQSTTDHKSRLLALVAERTGYPTDMLDLNLNIESDLGIDSIKRLEILIAFAKEIPGAPEDLPEQLNASKTLGEVLAMVGKLAPSSAPAAAPAVVTPVSGVPVESDHKSRLLTLVAERTGYPTDMLDLNLNIESDLGIDSIKRLEILIAFAKEIPGAPEDLPEQLNTSKTLGEVLEKVAEFASVSAQVPAPAVATPVPGVPSGKPLAGVYRNLIHLKAASLPEVDASIKPSGVVIVTDDGKGYADAMVKSLSEQGTKTRLIGTTARPGVEVVALHDSKAITAWIDSVRSASGPIGGVMHLLPLRPTPAMDSLKLADWQKLVDEEVKGLFYLLKAVAPDLKKGSGKCVLAATALGKSANNGSLPQPANPWRGGIMGLMKSVADEWPQAVCKVIDLSGETVAKAVPALLAETAAGLKQKEIYYRAGQRFVTQIETVALDRAKARMTFSKDDVILIIGGARGITSLIAQEIARRHQPTLILAGRSPWPDHTESSLTASLTDPTAIKKVLFEEAKRQGQSPTPKDLEKSCQRILADRTMRSNRANMEKAGSRVAYYPVDVTDEAGMTEMIKDIYAKFGRLDGVINGAGIIEDKLIEDKTPESFDRVFDNKVKSVYLLSRLLKPESLKFLVLFSSIAGWFGNRGQSDYAAANEVLNRMAMYLDQRWNNRVVAIDWGPWDQLGMASDQVKKQFQERGVGLIDPVAGRDYMLDELMYGERSQAIIVAEGQLI
jgi:acyl transferase domain-containing protein/NAD(P)-dependent dehydrogenase (short-subunit alcohol dehydrogenase family)